MRSLLDSFATQEDGGGAKVTQLFEGRGNMAKFSRVVEKSEGRLFKELGIKKRSFLESLHDQRALYVGLRNLHSRIYRTLMKRCDQALVHLQEIEKLQITNVAPLIQEAAERVKAQRDQAQKYMPMWKRNRDKKEFEACMAAAKIYDLLKERDAKQIGYYGGAALFYLGFDTAPPRSASKHDDATVNRFWTRCNMGKALPELKKEDLKKPL